LVALLLDPPRDPVALIAILLLVGAGQVLALRAETGSISVSAVGALIGVAIFGPGAAVLLALASVAVDVMLRAPRLYKEVFNTGILTVAALAASAPFLVDHNLDHRVTFTMLGLAAGGLYFACNTGLLSVMIGLQDGIHPVASWRRQYLWLAPHYVAYGLVAAVVTIAYQAVEIYALIAFMVPLALMRASQQAYIRHTSQASEDLREAAQTIRLQNVSLSESNQLLRDRSMSALEGLTATVDARDTYTAGHSRRVQTIALAIGRELGLSEAELQVLGYAGLFHDIGKLAIPDSILLKPGPLTDAEMATMKQHAVEGAAIVSRLGFLADAVPSVRHHHERFDGRGYPDRLAGRDIPLGARVIHVADALDSMLTTRVYRSGLPLADAIAELNNESGKQFCPKCVDAALRVLERNAATGSDVTPLGLVA
jgi:putative nucleotidyltransferase with HDIG domain